MGNAQFLPGSVKNVTAVIGRYVCTDKKQMSLGRTLVLQMASILSIVQYAKRGQRLS